MIATSRRRLPGSLAWGGLALGLGAGLAALAVAEVDWLHRLPAEHAATAAVLLFPADVADLAPAVQAFALGPAVIARLVAESGHTTEWLRGHLRVSSTCVETASAEGEPLRGLRVALSARGGAAEAMDRTVSVWENALLDHVATAAPGLVGYRQDAFTRPIRRCD